jgi:phenylacetic acid degradation operon negative regulatory protein
MGGQAEECLAVLMWSLHQVMHPTFSNLTEPYEAWAARNGFRKQIDRLTHRGLIEHRVGTENERLFRLTEAGRNRMWGERQPEEAWARPWDGRWRLVVFDVPVRQNPLRQRLRRYLKDRHFGYLQKSVWITPFPMAEEEAVLRGSQVDVGSLVLLEALTCAGEANRDIVNAAWDFGGFNRQYRRYLEVLDRRPVGLDAGRARFRRWAVEEQGAWLDAISRDPLLPQVLLPPGYLGRRAWQRRNQEILQPLV